MKTMRIALAIIATADIVPAGASAQQIVLAATNVVGASSVYSQGAGDQGDAFAANGARVTGTFGAGNLFNSQLADPTPEVFFSGDYFLTGDGQSYPTVTNPYITVDLGKTFNLSSFTLFNSSNGSFNDRDTGGFAILGGNSLIADGANGFTLGGAITTLASGTLAVQLAGAAPAAQSFAALSSAGFRYIQFVPTSVAAQSPYSAQAFGLNELKVFGKEVTSAVPEPASWALMMLGFGLMGAGLRDRARVGQRARLA